MVEKRQYKSSTLGVRAGQEPDPVTGACAVPIYQTSSYGFKMLQKQQGGLDYRNLVKFTPD